MIRDFIENVKKNIFINNLNEMVESSVTFKPNCSFYFENLTDDEFFGVSGAKEHYFDFYSKIAKSGVKNIVLGGVYVGTNERIQYNNMPRLRNVFQEVNDFEKVVNIVHNHSAKVFLQIKSVYGRYDAQNQLFGLFRLSASKNVNPERFNVQTVRISDLKCNKIASDIVKTSILSKKVGFDGVVIDLTFSNVAGELSSSELNIRKFGYYSNVDDFALKVLEEIGKDKKIFTVLKLSVSSLIKYLYPDYKKIKTLKMFGDDKINLLFCRMKKLILAGADGFEFVFGTEENSFLNSYNFYEAEDLFYEFFEEVRKLLKDNQITNKFGDEISLFINDNIKDFKGDKYIQNFNKNDYLNITKNILSDEKFLRKKLSGKKVNECIKCSFCEKKKNKRGMIECLANPGLKSFEGLNIVSLNKKTQIAVIGAGISGIICAIIAARRGINVHIYEKNSYINKTSKQMEIFGSDSGLKLFNKRVEDSFDLLVKQGQISVFANQQFDVENCKISDYGTIVVATGFLCKFLSVPGAIQGHVKNIYDVLGSNENFNKNHIVIVPKTELGFKLAMYLISCKKKVTILVDNLHDFQNMPFDRLSYYIYVLTSKNCKILFQTTIKRINEDNIEIAQNRELGTNQIVNFYEIHANKKFKFDVVNKMIDCDLLVYEPELYSNNKLYNDIVRTGFAGEVYMVGEALKISGLDDDIKSAFFVGKNI